jgi:hypothetical protein
MADCSRGEFLGQSLVDYGKGNLPLNVQGIARDQASVLNTRRLIA